MNEDTEAVESEDQQSSETGADHKLAFAEHPDIPEHWRERTA